ncbi:imidazole glycerol phosphate synthase subunit HisH [Thalassolituus sp. LLYu03]|uniref:imidazole glycerol phosphate synthase subunit HisH n=1 Tax=Thalassolituus sp. LLYu03 TaxID=3421656 RepID=UPI003D2AFB21
MKKAIGIIDYGAGNLSSVSGCFQRLGYHTRIVNSPDGWYGIDAMILPGVGAFGSAMHALSEGGFCDELNVWVQEGKPLLGICLGMQLFADISYEFGTTAGLGFIPGVVKPIADPAWHIGWNSLAFHDRAPMGLKRQDGGEVYFNHSFEFHTADEHILGVTDIGRPLVAIIRNANVVGVQFHPEKSQLCGMKVMSTLLEDMLDA